MQQQSISLNIDEFRNNVCRKLQYKGDIVFILNTLKSKQIRRLYEQHEYTKALYLLAMLDYLCKQNHLPICQTYNDIRSHKLSKPICTRSEVANVLTSNESQKHMCLEESIPEFKRFNIIETDIREVV